jgi:hypothetical protein
MIPCTGELRHPRHSTKIYESDEYQLPMQGMHIVVDGECDGLSKKKKKKKKGKKEMQHVSRF